MLKLPSEALWVLPCASERGGGWQRWTVGVPTGEGGGGEPDKRVGKEGVEANHAR